MFELGVLLSRWLVFGVGVMTSLQVRLTHSPAMNRSFGNAPMGISEWAWVRAGGLMTYAAVSSEKWLDRHPSAETGH